MPTLLNPDQIQQLANLGIAAKSKSTFNFLPLLSISGLTFISFGGLILFKSRTGDAVVNPVPVNSIPDQVSPSPTQVPKSIQHYLLTSQQYFTQALSFQSQKDSDSALTNLNQSILTASEAIKLFPSDYRGYEQRGRIYISLLDSQPKLLPTAIADLSRAATLNPSSAEITRTLATLYARSGDAQNTLAYLTQTVILEPTRAQNFYDLARLQQQTGHLPEALDTYNRLIGIVSDPTQRIQVETEKSAIENLLSQSGNHQQPSPLVSPKSSDVGGTLSLPDHPKLIEALADTGLIIAAPNTSQDIIVSNLIDSNALAGSATLPANQTSLTLTNSNLTPTSQVYLTVTKGGKNLLLQVKSKSKDSFTVGLDSPSPDDIEFKWWIINN